VLQQAITFKKSQRGGGQASLFFIVNSIRRMARLSGGERFDFDEDDRGTLAPLPFDRDQVDFTAAVRLALGNDR